MRGVRGAGGVPAQGRRRAARRSRPGAVRSARAGARDRERLPRTARHVGSGPARQRRRGCVPAAIRRPHAPVAADVDPAGQPHSRRSRCASTACAGTSGRRSTTRGRRTSTPPASPQTVPSRSRSATAATARVRQPGATTSRRNTAWAAAPKARWRTARSTPCSEAFAAYARSRSRSDLGRSRSGGRAAAPHLAPARARAFGRIVSREDAEDLTLGFPGVSHATAWSGRGPEGCPCGGRALHVAFARMSSAGPRSRPPTRSPRSAPTSTPAGTSPYRCASARRR